MTNDPFIQAFLDQVAAESKQAALEEGVFTLGSVRAALKMAPPDWKVMFDDQTVPVNLHSYRGTYAYLAIEPAERFASEVTETKLDDLGEPFEMNMAGYGTYTPGHSDLVIAQPVTVAEMLKALDLADGVEFEGYKGGQFKWTRAPSCS